MKREGRIVRVNFFAFAFAFNTIYHISTVSRHRFLRKNIAKREKNRYNVHRR